LLGDLFFGGVGNCESKSEVKLQKEKNDDEKVKRF
jgi:hypothetical protein